MSVLHSKFLTENGANYKGTQSEFSAALLAVNVEYNEVRWLGNIQVYTLWGTPVAWYYENRGYSKALGQPAWAAA